MDWKAITPALEQKLNPANVQKPNGKFGPKGDYIEGWHAISEANEIFGFGAWSYEIKGLTKDSVSEAQDRNGNVQWQAAYTCIVRVQVGDVVREDVGFGSGFAKSVGDAIEGATKEAVTDALKRALRTFGNRFGLALYDKSRANVGAEEPPFNPTGFRDRLKREIGNAKSLPELQDKWRDVQGCRAAGLLPDDMLEALNKAKDERKTQLTGPDPAMQAPPDDEEEARRSFNSQREPNAADDATDHFYQ